jgi:hypothetical protein
MLILYSNRRNGYDILYRPNPFYYCIFLLPPASCHNSDPKYMQQFRSIFSMTLFIFLALGVSFLTVNLILRLAEKLF